MVVVSGARVVVGACSPPEATVVVVVVEDEEEITETIQYAIVQTGTRIRRCSYTEILFIGHLNL